MAAGDINDALTNIPNVVLVDQTDASAAPGAGYARLEVVDGVLGVRVGTGAWVALVSLVAGLLTSLTEKVTPADTDLLLLQDEAAASALKKVQVGNLPGGAASGGLFDAIAVVAHHVTGGANGGTATSGSWGTRTLDTEVSDPDSICSLASNQITLAAGDYLVFGYSMHYSCNFVQIRLYNVTDAAVAVDGGGAYLYTANNVSANVPIHGLFTVGASKALELQYYVETTKSDTGQGYVGATSQAGDLAKLVFLRLTA